MDSDKVEGTVKEVVGKAKDAAGDLLGETGTQVAGKARAFSGTAQRLYADTAEMVRNKTTDSPLNALAVAAGLGFLLGAIWGTANATPSRPYQKRYRNDDQC